MSSTAPHMGTSGYVSPPMTYSNADKIMMRIGELDGICIIHAARLKDEYAVVVQIRNEEIVVLKDGPELFPSDGLVTKLRLLVK